jgi:cytochrome c
MPPQPSARHRACAQPAVSGRRAPLRATTSGVLLLACLAAGACLAACSQMPAFEEEDLGASAAEIAAGERLAQEQCATCHAVDRGTQSPLRNAPPFAYLGRNYPVSSLAEALAEGMITGHDSMPEWRLEPAEIRGLLGYIQSVQIP